MDEEDGFSVDEDVGFPVEEGAGFSVEEDEDSTDVWAVEDCSEESGKKGARSTGLAVGLVMISEEIGILVTKGSSLSVWLFSV